MVESEAIGVMPRNVRASGGEHMPRSAESAQHVADGASWKDEMAVDYVVRTAPHLGSREERAAENVRAHLMGVADLTPTAHRRDAHDPDAVHGLLARDASQAHRNDVNLIAQLHERPGQMK